MMGGFRNPAAPGLTRSLRINRQGPRSITGSNTGDGEQAHDQKRGPLSGEARLYRAHVKNTSDSMAVTLAPIFAITHGVVLLNSIARRRDSAQSGLVPAVKPLTTDQYAVQSIGKRHSISLAKCIGPASLHATASQ